MSIKRINREGNMPKYLRSFLSGVIPGENEINEVYECSTQEMYGKAREEELEVQVLIDKKNTGRAYLCALGASWRKDLLLAQEKLRPVFYFSELNESERRKYIGELDKARKIVREREKQRKKD